ncbi:MAG: glycosyltransferase family 4 protein [Anaerolineae bacterium]|nr:glycosyltransferase family 4 protein [Anaerolineae bacterium]
MNILMTITGYPPAVGGAQIHTHMLAKHLSNRHRVEVISQWDHERNDWLRGTTTHAPQAKAYVHEGIPVKLISPTRAERRRLSKDVISYYFRQQGAIRNISTVFEEHIAREAASPEIIHNVRMGREYLTRASLNLAKKRGIPFVFTPLHHPRWSGWMHRHFHKIYREADLLFALTEWERQTLVGLGVDTGKIEVIGHGPVLASIGINHLSVQIPDEKYILFLGQKYAYKGLEAVLNSAPLVWKNFPDVHFVFMGPPTEYSRRLFSRNQDPRIIEIGKVDLETKTYWLQKAEIMCLPSSQESFGGVYLEAWLSGCAVIGGTAPAVREVISDGEDGYIVQQDGQAVADKIMAYLRSPDQKQEMVEKGKRKVVSKFTWEKIAGKVEKGYDKVSR